MKKAIELILCHEDGTWSTEIVECDDFDALMADFHGYVNEHILTQKCYRKIVFTGLWNSEPELDIDDPRFFEEEEEE